MYRFFKRATKIVGKDRANISGNSVFWMGGLVPHSRFQGRIGPSISEARVWESPGFVEVLNRSRCGFSNGTGDQADIASSLRPTAFGLATFDFMIVDGVPTWQNIEIIGGETPGRQTVPRSELWGGIIILTRVHSNVCARISIDASYVTNGAFNRLRLERGSNGDIWGLFFLSWKCERAKLISTQSEQSHRKRWHKGNRMGDGRTYRHPWQRSRG